MKNDPFPRADLARPRIVEERAFPSTCPGGADRFESSLLLHQDNKRQQKSTTQAGAGLVPTQQTSTKINKYQQSQQKSAKVSKIIAGPRAQSAKVSKSQHFLL